MNDQSETAKLKDQTGFTSGFLLGLVVGGAGGFFISSKEGREIIKNLTPQLKDKLQELEQNEHVQKLVANLESLIPTSKGVEDNQKEKPTAKRFFFSGGSPLKS